MIKLFIVDDHQLVRDCLKALLIQVPGITIIGEAENSQNALIIIKRLFPDIILIDMNLPDMSGLDLAKKMLNDNSDLKIIAVTVYNDVGLATRALEAGIRGYLLKALGKDEIVRAIKTVYAGQRYIDSSLGHHVALNHIMGYAASPFSRLSSRECDIAHQVVQGKSTRAIGEYFKISPKTVNSYRYRIFKKLHINTNVELTRLAIQWHFSA